MGLIGDSLLRLLEATEPLKWGCGKELTTVVIGVHTSIGMEAAEAAAAACIEVIWCRVSSAEPKRSLRGLGRLI